MWPTLREEQNAVAWPPSDSEVVLAQVFPRRSSRLESVAGRMDSGSVVAGGSGLHQLFFLSAKPDQLTFGLEGCKDGIMAD